MASSEGELNEIPDTELNTTIIRKFKTPTVRGNEDDGQCERGVKKEK